MSQLVSFEISDRVATLAMDDGKVNVMSSRMLAELHRAFDRAEQEEAVVLLAGREGLFSAGFDLNVLSGGRAAMVEMLRLGATLAERILSFPFPVVVACTGHAYPMGAFLMLSADRRLGAEGPYRIGLNEVAIQITPPLFAIELARARLTPSYFQRIVTGEMFGPEESVTAGFLDQVTPPADLIATSREVALGLTKIDLQAHYATKLRVRKTCLTALRAAIDEEIVD